MNNDSKLFNLIKELADKADAERCRNTNAANDAIYINSHTKPKHLKLNVVIICFGILTIAMVTKLTQDTKFLHEQGLVEVHYIDRSFSKRKGFDFYEPLKNIPVFTDKKCQKSAFECYKIIEL
jgi:hypothetical protein